MRSHFAKRSARHFRQTAKKVAGNLIKKEEYNMTHRNVSEKIGTEQDNSRNCQDIRLLRKVEVMKMTGLPLSTMYAYIKRGTFPSPVKIGPRSSAWRIEEVKQWVTDRPVFRTV